MGQLLDPPCPTQFLPGPGGKLVYFMVSFYSFSVFNTEKKVFKKPNTFCVVGEPDSNTEREAKIYKVSLAEYVYHWLEIQLFRYYMKKH